jgi:hypothetical protein
MSALTWRAFCIFRSIVARIEDERPSKTRSVSQGPCRNQGQHDDATCQGQHDDANGPAGRRRSAATGQAATAT